MKKILLLITLLNSSLLIFSQESRKITAAEDVISKITEIENFLNQKTSMNIKLPNEIVCLTGIVPKKVDGTYVGIVYYPTLEEVKLWKEWFNHNQDKIFYDSQTNNEDSKKIIVKLDSGEIRSNFCK